MFSVGVASRPSPIFAEKGVHFISPTLPGWGNTSPVPASASFVTCLMNDMTELLNHLHPDSTNIKLYIAGGSYGTAPAQILFRAPHANFAWSRQVSGMLLLAPFSSFHEHVNYAKALSWENYIAVGPLAYHLPFKLVPHFLKLVMQSKLRTTESAEKFIRTAIFDRMQPPEREAFARWREGHNMAEGQLERELAENNVRSVSKAWDGFFDVPQVLHADWGATDEDDQRPVLVVASKGDTMLPGMMANWVVDRHRNAKLKLIDGGHLASLFYLDEIWAEFL